MTQVVGEATGNMFKGSASSVPFFVCHPILGPLDWL